MVETKPTSLKIHRVLRLFYQSISIDVQQAQKNQKNVERGEMDED